MLAGMADSYFIVIEGIDGAGKTSVARRLRDMLQQTHPDRVLLTNQPHRPSLLGGEIRAALAGDYRMSPRALALAFALNRVDHLERVIEPQLRRKQHIVICDRYRLSSLVYQSRDDIGMEEVYSLNRWARPPDLTIVLTVSPLRAYERLRERTSRRDIFENHLPARIDKYQRAVNLLRGKGQTVSEVDAEGDLARVFEGVLEALKQHKPAWLRLQPPLLI